ncbi:MAG: hypothetical protein HN742_10770 [Lentisphaerae bacterium]|jgi:biopolymer transport protein ExbD|nr:hypothetical protein [Lentisphaerota bacterium]MBT4818312.1 hypothetical protein [Lentisphaerota bacterium]MBT5608910.1 hypothetical protein [Lentisphaerota bacterium]MBT7053502.1 hypothetical protein [Lentisphaerota bacterium]MBT7842346.1 hypothetical protein [Lentisphaerota bacterium]
MSENEEALSVSDALLPLLDVSILLLGLFMILLSTQASQSQQEAAETDGGQSKAPAEVLLLTIRSHGNLTITSGGVEAREVTLETLSKTLSGSQADGDMIVLVQIEDPWRKNVDSLYRECLKILRSQGIGFSRVFK